MSGLRGRERLQPSLLDRLTDNAPGHTREAADLTTLTMVQLRQAVIRDLGALLNTTNLETLQDLSATPRAAKSTLNYGIPGFAGMTMASAGVATLERELREAIRIFEPRINPDTLRVRMRGAPVNETNPKLIFEIEGELWGKPLPQHLFLETSIEVETRHAVVTEVKGTP